MFKNNNKDTIRELAMENYHAHKTRNIVAILAIILTTVLITAVLTVGISLTSTMLHFGEAAPGPGCQGSVGGTVEQADQIRSLPQADYADFIQKCSTGPLRNEEFMGMQVWLMAPESSYYEHNYVDLLEGHYPKTGGEIIISDSMARRLGLENPVGSQLPVKILIQKNGEPVEETVNFRICGYFKNPLVSLIDTYDEIYTTQDFIREKNPELYGNTGDIYVHLNNLNPLLLKSDVQAKLMEVSDAVDGIGFGTKYTSSFSSLFLGMVPALLLVIIIILSGYFLIYNVFYISVAADIRWFGMIKTIGTTPRQLRQILLVQIRRLSLLGICLGVIIGYTVGNKIAPRVLVQTIYGQFYKSPNIFAVFGAGAIFSWLTILLSAGKSMRMASSISPVEAARFTPKKKRNLFTVLSLCLSGIIFMVACNATLGYSIDHMVNRYNLEDINIMHRGSIWDLDAEKYEPMDTDLPDQIASLPYVTSVDAIYMARTTPDYELLGNSPYYISSHGRVRPEGKLKEWMNAVKASPEYIDSPASQNIENPFLENGDLRLKIMGIPASRLEKNAPYVNLLEGEADPEKFASGDYILWSEPYLISDIPLDTQSRIHAGDKFPLLLYSDAAGEYYEKEVTVLGVIQRDNDMFGTSDFGISSIIMSDTLFKECYPDASRRIVSLQISTDGEINEEQNAEITALVSKTHNSQLQINSRYLTRTAQKQDKFTMQLIGILLSSLLGIIGISNVINTLTSDVFARKMELAVLQSIGMTKRQLWKMLFGDSMKFSLTALIIALPIGGILSREAASHPLFTGFSPSLFVISALLMIVIVTGIDIIVTSILVKNLNKKSIVERLREIE